MNPATDFPMDEPDARPTIGVPPDEAVKPDAGVLPESASGEGERPEASALCDLCRQPRPEDELLVLWRTRICASCKPAALHRLREGLIVPERLQSALVYAGFWRRFLAKFIDGLVLAAANWAMSLVAMPLLILLNAGSELPVFWFFAIQILLMFLQFVFGVSYYTWLHGRFGATLGKMALGLKVVRPDGSAISYRRAFGRYFGEVLSALLLYVGYLMVAFDEEKRGLHDLVCATRVIHKNVPPLSLGA